MPRRTHAEVFPAPGLRACLLCGQAKPLAAFGNGKRPTYCLPCKAKKKAEWVESKRGIVTHDDIARFWSRVDKRPDGCWIWTGHVTSEGYGDLYWAGKHEGPHRVTLFLEGRFPPEGKPYADHLCHVRTCCNPAHLRWVSERANAVENNDNPFARNARRVTCKRGHPYSDENTALKRTLGPKGTPMLGRVCLTCYPGNWRKAIVKRGPPTDHPRSRNLIWLGPDSL